MKYLRLYEDFVYKKAPDFVYKELTQTRGIKPTWILHLGPSVWKEVEHLFDEAGRPESPKIKKIPASGSVWDLYVQKYTSSGEPHYKVYGVSGDYTFGMAPGYYQSRYSGNKRAAKEVLDKFIGEFIIDLESLDRWIDSGKTLQEFKHDNRGHFANKKFGGK